MSEKKVLETLETHPPGLSISEIAKHSKLHRNTIRGIIKKLQENGKVELKKLGPVKIYYLKKYSSLHKLESGYKGDNISVGIGVSDLQDGYQAAISAAKQAVNQATKGEKPTFSLVFVSSRYNSQINKVVKGINKILGTKNWVGCTSDRELNSVLGYCEGTVEVLAIKTKYMYFGVGVAENYRKNPVESGKKATIEAINNCPVERSRFATVQFMRSTKKNFIDIVRNPPYFILTFPSGVEYKNTQPVPGRETEFLSGISEVVGQTIPIIGASASSDVIEFTQKNIGKNYQFANGKVYSDAAVVVFIVSDLYFSYGLEHGYKQTNKLVMITEVSAEGKIINELNGKPPVDEYCKMIGINKKEFAKNPWKYTLTYPLAYTDEFGNTYIKTIGPNPDGRTLYTLAKFIKGSIANILYMDKKNVINAMKDSVFKLDKNTGKLGFVLLFSCSARRIVLGKDITKPIEEFKKEFKNVPFFGFYTFGEIGAKKNRAPQYNNQTVTSLIVYDMLMIS